MTEEIMTEDDRMVMTAVEMRGVLAIAITWRAIALPIATEITQRAGLALTLIQSPTVGPLSPIVDVSIKVSPINI